QCLELDTRNDAAIWNAEPVTEFDSGAADDDLLVFDLLQNRRDTFDDVDIGNGGDGVRSDGEIDRDRACVRLIRAGEQCRHRRQEYSIDPIAKGVIPHKAVAFNSDIDDAKPRILLKLGERPVDVEVAFGCVRVGELSKRGQNDRASGVAESIGKYPVRGGI